MDEIVAAAAMIDAEWCESFRARTALLFPVIIDNIKTFTRAAREYLKDARFGKQIGTLLAGAHSLTSDERITHEAALEFIAQQNWEDQSTRDGDSDETRCFNAIVEKIIPFINDNKRLDMTINELITLIDNDERGLDDPKKLYVSEAKDTLARYGIKVKGGEIYISDSNKELGNILKGGNFEVNWKIHLRRLDGAQIKDCVKFGAGGTTRATIIKINRNND